MPAAVHEPHEIITAIMARLVRQGGMTGGHYGVALPPQAGICNIDGFDDAEGQSCSARTAHDEALVQSQRENRRAQWQAAEALDTALKAQAGPVSETVATADLRLSDLRAQGARIAARRAALNREQGHSHCGHCGQPVPVESNHRAHAIAGAGDERHPETGAPLRLRIAHCDTCLDSAWCNPGQPEFPGYCETLEG